MRSAGGSDAWRDDEAPPTPNVWTGSRRAYLREKRREVREGGASSFLVERTLIVALGAPEVDWAREQVVTFLRDQAAAPESAAVRDIERSSLPGVPAALQTTRLTLEPA